MPVLAGCASTQPQPKETPAPTPVAEQPFNAAKEAPALIQLVQEGKLPKLDERLPSNPMVLTPVDKIGTYGGTWRMAITGKADITLFTRTVGYEPYVRYTPDYKEIIPNVMEKWEPSAEVREPSPSPSGKA